MYISRLYCDIFKKEEETVNEKNTFQFAHKRPIYVGECTPYFRAFATVSSFGAFCVVFGVLKWRQQKVLHMVSPQIGLIYGYTSMWAMIIHKMKNFFYCRALLMNRQKLRGGVGETCG